MDSPFNSASRLDPPMREAIAIADAARRWFEGPGKAAIAALPPAQRLQANAEMLATTARLMAAIAWLLHPAHSAAGQGASAMPPFNPPAEPPMPEDHPLRQMPGGDIAAASRAFVQRLKDQP